MTHTASGQTEQSVKPARRHAATRLARLVIASAVAGTALAGTVQSATAATSTTELRASVVKLTNVARAAKGCKPLTSSSKLTKAAQRHAKDMSAKDYFSHTSADGRTWDERILAAGYKKPAGENIAYGFETPAAVLKGWMNSPGHRRNILDCSFRTIGIGYTADGLYWVQDFGY